MKNVASMLVVVMPLMALRAANAQSVGDLLPIAVPGYAVAPGVTVMSRLQHDAGLQGIDADGLTLDPSLGAAIGIDSAAGSSGTASSLLRAEPSVRVSDAILGLAGYAGASIARYPSDPGADANDVTAVLGLALPLGPDTATFGIARVATQQSALGVSQPGVTAPFGVVLNDGRLSLRLKLGQFDATERIDIGRASLSRTGTLPAAFDNRTTLRASSEIASQDDAVLRWLGLIKASLARYQGALPGAGFSNENALSLLGGVETAPEGVIRLRLLAGGVSQNFAARAAIGSARSGVTAIGSIGLGWTPDGLISAELDLTREAGIETTLGTPGTAVTSADLTVAEAYTRDLRLTAAIDARAGSVAGRSAREIDFATGLTLHVSADVSLAPALSYAIRHHVPGAAVHEATATIAVVWNP